MFTLKSQYIILLSFLTVMALSTACIGRGPVPDSISLKVVAKEVTPDNVGECTYRATLILTNVGNATINSMKILVEVYDPENKRAASSQLLSIENLSPKEERTITSSLRAHCRSSYTLRAYAEY